jgi:hypothetical protein
MRKMTPKAGRVFSDPARRSCVGPDFREIHGDGMKISETIATPLARGGMTLCMALSLAGCASIGSTYGNTTGAPATGIYVIQNTASHDTTAASGAILQFSSTASGAASPVSTIATTNVAAADLLATDALGNLYTTAIQGAAGRSLIEYPAGSANGAHPVRSIPFNSTTRLDAVNGLAVDPTGGIYASEDSGGIAIFSSTATGSVAPGGYILGDAQTGGGLSTLVVANAVTTDAKGNFYVIDGGVGVAKPIVVFSTTATGNVAPTRSLGGALTTMAAGTPRSLATDTAGNLYVANVVAGVSSILVFDHAASGNAPPLRTIGGSSTLLGCAGGIAVDTEGGFLYVVSTPRCGDTANPTVLKFSTTGTGNIAPISKFNSSAWTNGDSALSIAVY